jgi:hypothetical protein
MEFLKKHYEKMVLCVILLGLAGAAVWMRSAIQNVKQQLQDVVVTTPPKTAPLTPIDLSADQKSLEQITNPPLVVLSGDHNLFNPVTWNAKPTAS